MSSISNTVLVEPIVTEKTVAIPGKYTFKVHSKATKPQVVKAVKEFYGVDVDKVNMTAIRSKERSAAKGKTITKRPESKKAVVTLKAGEVLNFNDFK